MSFGSIYSSTQWGLPVENGWGGIYFDLSNPYNALTLRYNSRVLADGGVVESLDCVNSADFIANNWAYYFRVLDDGGVVESLECVNSINPVFLLKEDNGYLLQENGFKIII